MLWQSRDRLRIPSEPFKEVRDQHKAIASLGKSVEKKENVPSGGL